MQERNVITGMATTILSSFVDGWEYIVVWLIVAFALIIGDLRFGLCAARKRGEKIRGSRAIRRTINKMVDYLCWVSIAFVLGGSFGRIFGVPLMAAIIMAVICIVELSSIFDNYFEYKGISKKFNVWKFFAKILRIEEIEEAIQDKEK